uniref:Uncharacterized protein n=1 Tax=Opuntia streptacantha TaxID=393608 RepID=A0A7C9E3C8_OPUST
MGGISSLPLFVKPCYFTLILEPPVQLPLNRSPYSSILPESDPNSGDTHPRFGREAPTQRRSLHRNVSRQRSTRVGQVPVGRRVHVRRRVEEGQSQWQRQVFMAIWGYV